MTDIAFDSSHVNLRIAGICIHDGHVLLTWDEKDDFWTLPGGRPHPHEPSGDALVREMEEEIATRVDVHRLLWIVENFFEYLGARFHEIAFYYQIGLPEHSPVRDVEKDFISFEEIEGPFLFRWFPIADLVSVNLHPMFLRTALSDLPQSPVHVIQVDPPKSNES